MKNRKQEPKNWTILLLRLLLWWLSHKNRTKSQHNQTMNNDRHHMSLNVYWWNGIKFLTTLLEVRRSWPRISYECGAIFRSCCSPRWFPSCNVPYSFSVWVAIRSTFPWPTITANWIHHWIGRSSNHQTIRIVWTCFVQSTITASIWCK